MCILFLVCIFTVCICQIYIWVVKLFKYKRKRLGPHGSLFNPDWYCQLQTESGRFLSLKGNMVTQIYYCPLALSSLCLPLMLLELSPLCESVESVDKYGWYLVCLGGRAGPPTLRNPYCLCSTLNNDISDNLWLVLFRF